MSEESQQPSGERRSSTVAIVASIAVVVVVAAVATIVAVRRHANGGAGGGGGTFTPSPTVADAATYQRAVSAFYVGVIALQVDDNDRAKLKLTEATQVAPEEPAAWADLGLYYLRAGDFEQATRAIDRALALPPASAEVETLAGLLESRRGDFAKAAAHLNKAVELSPGNPRARYALATVLDRQGGPGADAAVAAQLAELRKIQPRNPAVLLEVARSAAKQGDAPGLRSVVGAMEPLAATWTPDAQAQFKLLRDAASAENVRPAATAVLRVRNVLLATVPFRRAMNTIESPLKQVGQPIDRFLKLPSPSPDPAAADEAMTFEAKPLGVGGSGWSAAAPVWPAADAAPVVFVASAREVRQADGKGVAMAFPGGANNTAPTPEGLLALDWRNTYATGLALAGAGGVRLMQPGDGGAWGDVTATAIADAAARDVDYVGAWPADLDLDGDLDLILARRSGPPAVLRNNGDGTFVGVAQPFGNVANLRQFAWADLDGDGIADACLLDDAGHLAVFINDRSMKFRPRTLPGEVHDVIAVTTADLTRRGVSDVVALLADGTVLRLWDDAEAGAMRAATVAKVALPAAKDPKSIRLLAADVDDNGAVDLLVAGDATTAVLLGSSGSAFVALPQPIAARVLCAVPDAGASGGLRLVGVNDKGEPLAIEPRGTKGYHHQIIRPRASATGLKELAGGSNRINTFAIGGQLELRAGLLYASRSITTGAVHFGLGTNPGAEGVRIVWPNGNVQGEFGLPPDQAVTADQRLQGSCPMLFTYDGRGVQFVTDLIWRSPLGLRINAQDTAAISQTEDWVKVRGDQLAPHDGYYDLRVTAELWETHFFDLIQLMTVDHPAGTEVYVDERFSREPQVHQVFVTKPARPFARAVDHRGVDVSEVVRNRDGKYLDGFARGMYQGVATDHWVELELPSDATADKPLALVGFGWVHPTDSSVNVALAQGNHVAPSGLVMEVADGSGGWKVAREGIGFPAGKNKTVVLSLENVFVKNAPRRLRLRTNLEVFWDQLGWAELVPDAHVVTQRLSPQEATLAYRGFSVIEAADRSSPELPQYDHLMGSSPRWPDLQGFYTRFGDVQELLEKVDDRYVIMNAGDEMRLRFAPPAAPGDGAVRDFVVIADGWEKDGNHNTAFSRTVLPLPRHDWPAYDAMPARLEDDPAYRRHPEDWVNYHTRYVGGEAFYQAMKPNE